MCYSSYPTPSERGAASFSGSVGGVQGLARVHVRIVGASNCAI